MKLSKHFYQEKSRGAFCYGFKTTNEIFHTLDDNIVETLCSSNSQIIEVKKSAGAVKTDQIDRLVDTNNKEFYNYNKKEVVLYIDAPLENAGRIASEKIDYIRNKGVKVVNSLEELREVLK